VATLATAMAELASIGSIPGGVAMLVDNTTTELTLINTILVTLARWVCDNST